MKTTLLVLAVLVGMIAAFPSAYAIVDTSKNPDEVCINGQCEAEQN